MDISIQEMHRMSRCDPQDIPAMSTVLERCCSRPFAFRDRPLQVASFNHPPLFYARASEVLAWQRAGLPKPTRYERGCKQASGKLHRAVWVKQVFISEVTSKEGALQLAKV